MVTSSVKMNENRTGELHTKTIGSFVMINIHLNRISVLFNHVCQHNNW